MRVRIPSDTNRVHKPKPCILVAEDYEQLRDLYTIQLEHLGYRVKVASNGKQAVDLIRDNGIDLIFMDIMMPIMDGYEATRQIRSIEKLRGKHVPIVGLSSLNERDKTNEWKAVGMDAYVQKPPDILHLEELIQEFVRT